MPLNRSREPAALRLTDHVNNVAVPKLIYQNLVAYVGALIRSFEAKLFEHAGRGNAAAGLLEVTAHRFIDILHSDGPIFDQADLHGIVTVTAAGSFLLHHDTGTGLNNSHRSDRAIRREQLRHPNFLANDSVNHFRLPIAPLPMADLSIHDYQAPIGNWQLEIGNAVALPERLNLNIHACRQVQLHQRVDCLRSRIENI